MKVKKLNIQSYKHLENLCFDFTYPKGHKKEGEPLDKVCIIGQSATGKTNILELIKTNFSLLSSVEVLNNEFLFRKPDMNFSGEIEYRYNDKKVVISEEEIILDGKHFKELPNDIGGGSVGNLFTKELRLLYFTSDLISKETINLFDQNPVNIVSELSFQKQLEAKPKSVDQNYIYEFIQDVDKRMWFSLLGKILDYRKRFTQMASELINKGAIGDIAKLNKLYGTWTESNENPLISFAEYFNPLLNKLNLEIDLVNTEYAIPIKSKFTDEIVPISGLSTGTKGLLLSMFPLFELNTKDSIILLDEPEKSLFPDIQIDLISYYQKLAPTSQIFVATHSPFIAAAFEPEERFILYFNEVGKVMVRKGESPIGDDPNDILRKDFEIDYYNQFGKDAYQKYLDLRQQVSQEESGETKKDLLYELTALGDKYNF